MKFAITICKATLMRLTAFSFVSVRYHRLSLGLGETDTVAAEVVDGVVSAEESITENGKRTSRGGDIEAHEGRDTRTLDLKDVVVGANGEVVAGQGEAEVRERVTRAALDSVLAIVALLGTDLLVQQLSKSAGKGNERSAGVEDGTHVVELGTLLAEGDGVKVNLPVGLASQRELGELAGVVVLVDTTEDGLGLSLLVVGVAEVEGEDRLVEQVLVNHRVERRGDLVDTDGVVSKTEDTVEAAEGESQARLLSGLTEELVLDLDVTNLDSVLRDVTLNSTRAVADGKVGAVLLVRRRVAVVVLVVEIASDGTAVRRGDPQVGAASVEDDLELLGRVADGNLGEV